jgi:exodeoxyribonuclease-1
VAIAICSCPSEGTCSRCSRALHDAAADVDAMLGLCRLVRAGAPDLWSTFLRFSAKAAVVDFVREEEAFAYFDYFGRPQVMHFLTRFGINPNDGNSHYCLDLASDIDALRKLDDTELSQLLTQEPRPIRRLKVNASPLLYPMWDIEPDRFVDLNRHFEYRGRWIERAIHNANACAVPPAADLECVFATIPGRRKARLIEAPSDELAASQWPTEGVMHRRRMRGV